MLATGTNISKLKKYDWLSPVHFLSPLSSIHSFTYDKGPIVFLFLQSPNLTPVLTSLQLLLLSTPILSLSFLALFFISLDS
jgi:hypothetical protein